VPPESEPCVVGGRGEGRGTVIRRLLFLLLAAVLGAVAAAALPGRIRPLALSALATRGAAWTSLDVDGAPPRRSQYGMAADTAGNVYVYGGSGEGGVALGDSWVLRPGDRSWREIANAVVPPLIEAHLATDAAGNVYELGGIGSAAGGHFSYDGHSYGLYEYSPASGAWSDLTPPNITPGVGWPLGREDFGFAGDPLTGQLYVFAGEGPTDGPLNDMWAYDLAGHRWSEVGQRYSAPGGATIDSREIYNISYDYHGGFYLFGGSYLFAAKGAAAPPLYANDLWHFDGASQTWTLMGGKANGYDREMPLPRHYYGQSCDQDGNFYLLDGYVSDATVPPYFGGGRQAAHLGAVGFDGKDGSTVGAYAIEDFWRYTAREGSWLDLSNTLGDLANKPAIPYAMVTDPYGGQLVTFGGWHPAGGTLRQSSGSWSYPLLARPGPTPEGPWLASPARATPLPSATVAVASRRTVPVASPTARR